MRRREARACFQRVFAQHAATRREALGKTNVDRSAPSNCDSCRGVELRARMHGVSLAGSVCQPILPVLKSCYERLGKRTISKEK